MNHISTDIYKNNLDHLLKYALIFIFIYEQQSVGCHTLLLYVKIILNCYLRNV